MNNLNLTEEQVQDLMNELDIEDENGNLLFELISKKYVSHDFEKNSVEFLFKIKDVKSGKKYKATLRDSDWYLQSQYNAKVNWAEIK